MPDQILTRQQLNASFPDNTSEEVSPQDIRNLAVSLAVYAEIGSPAKTQVTLGTGWQALDFDVAGVSIRGLTADTGNKWISGVPCDMEAELELFVLFRGALATSYDFTVWKNPAGTPEEITRMSIPDVNILNVSQDQMVAWKTTVSLSAGDVLQPAVRANGAAFTLRQGVFRVSRKAFE